MIDNEITQNEQAEQPIRDEKRELEIEKLSLEKSKLIEEIKHLQRPLQRNPQYLAPIVTIIVASLTLAYTFFSGFWDVQMKKLENTKLVLQIDIDKFGRQKDILNEQVLEYQKQKDLLVGQNKKLKTKYDEANKKYNEVANKYKTQKEEIAKELLEIDNLIVQNKNKEAFDLLRKVVVKLKGWENKNFDPFEYDSNEFD